ncbi:MAG: hypothetical protein AB7O98_15200 [Hyphomonadaceae bacterium]
MTNVAPATDAGRTSAFVVYVLYLLSIPSAGVFALIGVILALVARDGAAPLPRAHLDDQIRFWFVAFWWAVALVIAGIIGVLLTIVIIGIPILWAVGIVWLIVGIWFTIKSVLGLLALLDNRAV